MRILPVRLVKLSDLFVPEFFTLTQGLHGRSSRKFGFKEQFTTMAFIQLAARRSMRDGLRCLEAVGTRLYHWGLKTVARSTFADANNSRPVEFFRDMFDDMYAICATKAPKHKFRFKSKLFSLDSTTIRLCLSLFPTLPAICKKQQNSYCTDGKVQPPVPHSRPVLNIDKIWLSENFDLFM